MNVQHSKHSISQQIFIILIPFLIALIAINALVVLGLMVFGGIFQISQTIAIIISMLFFIVAIIFGVLVFVKLRRYFEKILD